MITITTPDGQRFTYYDANEASIFVRGFMAALECYGVWKDGEQLIGVNQTNIYDIAKNLNKQLE